MSRSVWSIFFIGLGAVGVLSMGMCMTMMTFSDSAAGQLAKLSVSIQGRFELDAVGARIDLSEGKKVLKVVYDTRKNSGFDQAVQKREMTEVGSFALEAMDPKERRDVEEVRVTRKEIRDRGCWHKTYVAHQTLPNPHRGLPGRRLPPNPR